MIKLKYLQIIVIVILIITACGCQKAENQNNFNINSERSTFKSIIPSIASADVTPRPTPSNTPVSSKPYVNTPIPKKGYSPIKKAAISATSTPEPTRSTPDAIKTPIVSCDGDVCRIITDE